jgi:hypothetical protein
VYAQLFRFSTKEGTAFANESKIPCAGGMNRCTECSYALDVANAKWSILNLLARFLLETYACSKQALESAFNIATLQPPKPLNTAGSEGSRHVMIPMPQTTGRIESSGTRLLTLQTKRRISNRSSRFGVANAVTLLPTYTRNDTDLFVLR